MELFYFYGKTCGPCRVVSNAIDKGIADGTLNMEVTKIEAGGDIRITLENPVTSVPTVVLVADYKEIWRHSGLPFNAQEVRDIADAYIETHKGE